MVFEVSRLRLKKNFDRFNFEIYKEKEMADFRRWITVLAVMALFVGLASAQVGTGSGSTGTPFSCSVQNTVTPNLRSEGYTEQTGDIVLQCTGGSPLALGSPIPTVNITVFYNVPAVTSRLLTTINGVASGVNSSEALLLIDEPNGTNPNSQSGYGPSLPQILCNNPANGAGPNGCPQVVGTANSVVGVPVTTAGGINTLANQPGPNMYVGVVAGASVTFNGIPVLPPATTGFARVYRITNVRVNANGVGGAAAGPGQVNASISISPSGSLPITNPNPIVGYINQGLKSSVGGAVSFNQCKSQTGAFAALLNFTENFGTAFKTRVDGFKSGLNNNYGTTGNQNSPGIFYNSESGFIANGVGQAGGGIVGNGSIIAGLADYGTRLKAVFTNVPTGATIFVSTTNVTGSGNAATAVANPNSNTTATSFATLLIAGSESTPDGSGASGNLVPSATATNSFSAAPAPQYVAYTSQGNPIVAVWEVLNTQPTFVETFSFSAYVAYTSTATFPPQGNVQVAFSLAANPTQGSFSAANGGTSAVNSPIPRFADTSGATGNSIGNFFQVNLCQTVLLFPYLTTVTGFETGIAIANTTTDPFKTTPQQGICNLYWYNTNGANPPTTATGIVNSGQTLTALASATGYAGPNFTGYMIAQCYFQLAHGTAVVTDYGAQKIVSVYLALVVGTGTAARDTFSVSNPETLGN
jgi:hypothetical protein